MELYHVTPGQPFDNINLEQFGNPRCDFNLKCYLHFFWEDVLDFRDYLGTNYSVFRIEVPDIIMDPARSSIDGFSILPVGYCGVNHQAQMQYMSRQERIDFMRTIISNRLPEITNGEIFRDADIMYGSRADNRVMNILRSNILTIDDYNDDSKLNALFDEMLTMELGPQIAFSQDALDHFSNNGQDFEWLT